MMASIHPSTDPGDASHVPLRGLSEHTFDNFTAAARHAHTLLCNYSSCVYSPPLAIVLLFAFPNCLKAHPAKRPVLLEARRTGLCEVPPPHSVPTARLRAAPPPTERSTLRFWNPVLGDIESTAGTSFLSRTPQTNRTDLPAS